jgi:hypothetical protein
MVVMNDGVQASSQNRKSRHDFPTPSAIDVSETITRLMCVCVCRGRTGVANEQELKEVTSIMLLYNLWQSEHTLIKKS